MEKIKKNSKILLVVLMLLIAGIMAFAGCSKDEPPTAEVEALFLNGADYDGMSVADPDEDINKYAAGWQIMLTENGYYTSDVKRIGFYLESDVPTSLAYNDELTTTYDTLLTDTTKRGLVKVYSNDDCSQLAFVSKYKIQAPTNCSMLFMDLAQMALASGNGVFSNLLVLDLNNFYTDNVTNMSYMFGYCEKLTSLDLSKFNTRKVKNMSNMFEYCTSLTTLDLSNFVTSNVTKMQAMFKYCGELTNLNLSRFNTSKVTDMSYMFYSCEKLPNLNLKKFDTSKVTAWSSMFSYTFAKNTGNSYLEISDKFVISGFTATKSNLINLTDLNANVQLLVNGSMHND